MRYERVQAIHVYDYIQNNQEIRSFLLDLCTRKVKKGGKEYFLTKRMIVKEMMELTENKTTDQGIPFSRVSINYAVNKFLSDNNLTM